MNHCLSKVLLSVEFLWLVQVLHPKAGVVQCTGSCLLWELVVEGSNMILLIFYSALQPLNNTQYSALPRFQLSHTISYSETVP